MNGSGMSMGMSPQMTGNSSMSNMMNMGHSGFQPSPHGMHHDHRSQHGFPGQGYNNSSQHHSMSGQGYGSHSNSPQPPMFSYWSEASHHGSDQSRAGHYNNHNPGHNPNAHMMYGPMDGMGHQQHMAPMQVNHTGMSSMHSYQSSRMNSPMPHHHGQSPMPHQMPMHGVRPPPQHQHNAMGMQPGMYAGQTHLHVGMGGGPMGGRFNNSSDYMGGNMNVRPHMGVNHFQGPHPGLSIHCGEQGKLGKAHQVWITGEFFGVQRARDMLSNAAAQKVCAGRFCCDTTLTVRSIW